MLGGHEILLDAYNTDVRPLCAKVARQERRGRRPGRRAARVGLRGERGRGARGSGEPRALGGRPDERHHPDRGARSRIAGRADRQPTQRRARAGAVRLAPARRRPGASRTTAAATPRPRGPPSTTSAARSRRCGSRARAAIWRRWRRRTSRALRLDEILPLFERDAMSDEEMVAYLARCQLDPAAPRSSIETLLHAFVPAAHVHHTHPDAINVLACAARRARADRRVLRRGRPRGSSTSDPGSRSPSRSAHAVRGDRDLRLVVLAKHGLITWGDTAREAYERTIAVCNQAAEFVNRRAHGRPRFGGPGAARSRSRRRARASALCARVLPALRGAVSSERCEGARRRSLARGGRARRLARRAPRSRTVGAACPDHLVHTKRVPLWVPYDPATDTRRRAGRADRARRRRATASEYAAYVERHREPRHRAGGSRSARGADRERRDWWRPEPRSRPRELSRDLYHRAIEVMAGASAIIGVRLARRGARASRSSTGRSSSTSCRWRRRRASSRARSRSSPAPPAGSARAIAALCPRAGACVVAFDIDGDGAADAVARARRRRASRSAATSPPRRRRATRSPRRSTRSAGSTSSSRTPASPRARRSRRRRWPSGTATSRSSAPATSSSRARRSACCARRAPADRSCSSPPRTRWSPDQNAAAYSSAKAAELHLARCLAEEGGSAGIRVNTVNPDAVLQGSRIWDSSWREERAAAYGIAPDELEEHYRNRTVLGVAHPPRGHRAGGAALRLAGPLGQEHRQPAQRRRRRDRRVSALVAAL